jgi:hypothetical protein
MGAAGSLYGRPGLSLALGKPCKFVLTVNSISSFG